jgi:DNA-binding transcriptional MerR regulator
LKQLWTLDDVIQEQQAEAVLTMPTAKRKQVLTQMEVVIPEKIYFRIGEVSELAKLPTYVLRFWETEFSQLRPTKSSTGQRMYRRRDVEFVMQIRKLLYEDGFTIAGARERLREGSRSAHSQEPVAAVQPSIEAATEVLAGEQTALLFPAPLDGSPQRAIQRRRELERVRRQLCEVLSLLS